MIWDSIRERLFAARDAQGGRELYYALAGGRLAFATCLSSVMTLYRIRERRRKSAGCRQGRNSVMRRIF